MNRAQFLAALKRHLRSLPEEERSSALEYYTEYFDEAGSAREAEIIAELGSPAKLAAQIRGEFALSAGEGKKIPGFVIVLLALFSAPVALPLGIVLVLSALVLMAAAFITLAAFAVGGLAVFITGLISIAAGILLLGQSAATALFLAGCGLAGMGAGLLLVLGMVKSIILLNKGLRKFGKTILDRRHKNEAVY
ncbi:MAG: DUF1700 domain-containing protein [Eubacterium sp.]|nr:DUF1700 domain-containing protein [Eubacterium sp.]